MQQPFLGHCCSSCVHPIIAGMLHHRDIITITIVGLSSSSWFGSSRSAVVDFILLFFSLLHNWFYTSRSNSSKTPPNRPYSSPVLGSAGSGARTASSSSFLFVLGSAAPAAVASFFVPISEQEPAARIFFLCSDTSSPALGPPGVALFARIHQQNRRPASPPSAQTFTAD